MYTASACLESADGRRCQVLDDHAGKGRGPGEAAQSAAHPSPQSLSPRPLCAARRMPNRMPRAPSPRISLWSSEPLRVKPRGHLRDQVVGCGGQCARPPGGIGRPGRRPRDEAALAHHLPMLRQTWREPTPRHGFHPGHRIFARSPSGRSAISAHARDRRPTAQVPRDASAPRRRCVNRSAGDMVQWLFV